MRRTDLALPRAPLLAAALGLVGLLTASSRGFVAVLGAGGKTGRLCVEALRNIGAEPRALSRSGGGGGAADDSVDRADVTDYASLTGALAGASAVIFAAAFSRGRSLPKDVDNAGLVNAARAVKELRIPRLVVVSSAATTRPYAPVGALLNLVGSGVLLEKLQGEREMRGILEGSGSTYTVLKPGGLKQDGAVGPMRLEFNQGDTLVGSVPRADVAAVAAAAATDPENRGAGKTFELYEAASKNPLMPWYPRESRYAVAGRSDLGEMLGAVLPDGEVTDVPGFLPF